MGKGINMSKKQLCFYEVDAKYMTYLYNVDSKVPIINYSATGGHDKFLCGIVMEIGNYHYFAPITSFNKKQQTNMLIKNINGDVVSSIRFCFMIPVPLTLVTVKNIANEPDKRYRRLLNEELAYCRKNANTIYRLAKYTYNKVINDKDPLAIKNCCDFTTLEKACDSYAN
jgi:protein AbiQ